MKRIERKKSELTTNNKEYKILAYYELKNGGTYDEDWNYRSFWKTRSSVKYNRANKERHLYGSDVRMYRTWKHTRKHQWK